MASGRPGLTSNELGVDSTACGARGGLVAHGFEGWLSALP